MGTASIEVGGSSVLTTSVRNQISVDSETVRVSTFDIGDVLQSQVDVNADGTQLLKYYDTHDTPPYTEVDITRDILGHITGTSVTTDVNVAAIGGSIGQVLRLGDRPGACARQPFAQLAAGTVAGAIGQKLGAGVEFIVDG